MTNSTSPSIKLPTMLTVKQVASHLQISTRQVYRHMKDGNLRSTKIGGNTRITENDLALFIATSGNK